MIRSMSAAVTGLRGHQQKLDVIGNNIANVNTMGFKKSQARFEDLLSQTIQGATAPHTRGGINPSQVGMGMRVSSIVNIHFQGPITNTDRETDLAIEGEGFFVLTDGSSNIKYYTRDGSFARDGRGDLVNVNGLKVMGFSAPGSSDLIPINIPLGHDMMARASQNLGFAGNLDARSYFAAINEEQMINLNGATGGTFTLTYNGISTTVLNYNASAASIRTALEGLPGINPGDVSVSGAPGNWTVLFTGALAGTDISELGLDGSGLEYNLAIVNTLTEGDGTNNERQQIYLDEAMGGTFVITLNDGTNAETFTLAYNVTAAALQAALEGHTGVASGDITVSGEPGNWVVEFTGNLANTDISEMTIDASGLQYDLARVSTAAQGRPETADAYTYEYYTFDSLGRRYNLDYVFTPVGGNTWSYNLTVTDELGATLPLTAGGSGVLSFDTLGNLNTSASTTPAIRFQPPNAAPLVVTPAFSTITQLAGPNSLLVREQDGYAAGEMVAFSISRTGEVIGTYTNGLMENLGQIALAHFANPEGLTKEGSNLYVESSNSGKGEEYAPGEGGTGLISSSSLEMSNTDLAYEFTELITTSRAFQANTRVVTTSDEVLVEVINMKR